MAPSLTDFSLLSPESLDESLDAAIEEDDAPPGVDERDENSTAPLRRKIEEIKLEKFDAKAKIAASKVLTQTIRTIGVQQLNFDVERAAYRELCPLDVDKENLVNLEIASRLNRVEKIEIARPIRCSFGAPKIDDFAHLAEMSHSSTTFRNLAHVIPTLQSTRPHFCHLGAREFRKSQIRIDPNFDSV